MPHIHDILWLPFLATDVLARQHSFQKALTYTTDVVDVDGPEVPAASRGSAEGGPGRAYRQRLSNFHDLQYSVSVTVGRQPITGILDTGSSSLVVFGKRCRTCGIAAAYDERASHSYVRGQHRKELEYDSGSCQLEEAHEDVALGPFTARGEALWTATSCAMPLLEHAAFNAVLGLSPPGREARSARESLQHAQKIRRDYERAKLTVPEEVLSLERRFGEDLDVALAHVPLPRALGLQSVSVCLGRTPGSHGFLVWNDTAHASLPGALKLPLAEAFTWSVALRSLGLEQQGRTEVAGCQSGCGALLDTGSSLLGVPGSIYRALRRSLRLMKTNCSDLRTFPDLVMRVGGGTLRLPPDSYVGSLQEGGAATFATLGGRDGACSLLLFDTGSERTPAGPPLTLGVPLFREYYTTFDFGRGQGSEAVSLTPVGDGCQPGSTDLVRSTRASTGGPVRPREIDPARIRIPQWARFHAAAGDEGA